MSQISSGEPSSARRAALPALSERLSVASLRVSPACVGMVRDPRVIPAAFEAGINFFFLSADMHWPLYEQTRRGLRDLLSVPGRRDDVVIAAVCYPTQPEFCDVPFAEVLGELPELGRLDVLLAGGAYARDFDERLPVYQRHRAQGRHGARAIGATFHDRLACGPALAAGSIDVGFARFNPAHPGARRDIFPQLPAARPPLYVFKTTSGWVSPERAQALGLPEELWLPGHTDHYRYALGHAAIDGLLVAPGEPAHVAQLADALAAGPLSADEEEHLEQLAALGQGTHALRTP